MGIDVTGIVKSAAVGLVGKNLRRVAGNVGNVLRGAGLGGDSSETAPLNRTKGAAVGGATKMLSFPLDVANADLNKGNHGHYILFEINVQQPNKLGFNKDDFPSVEQAIGTVVSDDEKKNGKNNANFKVNPNLSKIITGRQTLKKLEAGVIAGTQSQSQVDQQKRRLTELQVRGEKGIKGGDKGFGTKFMTGLATTFLPGKTPEQMHQDLQNNKIAADIEKGKVNYQKQREKDYGDANAYDNPKSNVYIKRPATTKLTTVITMFMPSGIKTGYKAEYINTTIGAGAKLASGIYTDSINPETASTPESRSLAVDKLQDNSGELAQALGTGLLLKTLAAIPVLEGVKEVAEMQSGQILSDRMELAFKGIGKREFVYEFKMMPRSAKEAAEIVAIIAMFKNHMLPKMLGAAARGKRMSIPDTFDIKYMFGDKENSFLNKVSTCFLSDMQVTYGGGKFRAHDGGEPTETTISLTFKEIEIITRQKALEGF